MLYRDKGHLCFKGVSLKVIIQFLKEFYGKGGQSIIIPYANKFDGKVLLPRKLISRIS
jgi:hypothetical protein